MNTENIHKLVTKEDIYHLHKTLGICTLLHFGYRFYLFLIYGTFCFYKREDMYLIGLHGVLSTSSLIFHISKTRNHSGPMIYPEFRMHSIIFTLRSVVCCYISYFYRDNNTLFPIILKIATVFLTMLSADYATIKLRESNTLTPMRNISFGNNIEQELQVKIKLMYSTAQVYATLFMLKNVDTAFLPLWAIQIAALLMTMVRKNIIKPKTWHVLYTLSLWINVFLIFQYKTGEIINFNAMMFIFKKIRFDANYNKYLSWSFVFLLYLVEYKYKYFYNVSIIVQNMGILSYLLTNFIECKKLFI
jgi:hypothetical protein